MADARVLRDLAEEVEGWLNAEIKAAPTAEEANWLQYDPQGCEQMGLSDGKIEMAQRVLDRIRALAADLKGTK